MNGDEGEDGSIGSLLAAAKRETLMLAIASGAADDEAAAIAWARLRWATDAVRPLIVRLARADGPRATHWATQLDRIANRAQRWLVDHTPLSLPAIGALVDRRAIRHDRRARGDAIDASDASLVDLDLDDLVLARIALPGAGLTDVTARRATLDAADARRARWLRCQLGASSLAAAVFTGGALDGCDLSRANLEATSWHRTQVCHCVFDRATLIDTRLDRAVFRDCDLRGADLELVGTREVAALAGAQFVRCDLRETNWGGRDLGGAAFIDCKLFGAHGAPRVAGVTIERADISLVADGSKIGAPADVAAAWRTMIGAAGQAFA
jgi:uncharacterized protein YjbI with pentapeptide repeats